MPLPLIWSRLLGFGRRSEIRGAAYLRTLGYRLLASSFRTRQGEIDIVAQDGECLVFVEVKARGRDPHPEDSVTSKKQRRIARAARTYRSRHRSGNQPYRFDILAVIDPEGAAPRYRLIKDAFRMPDHQP